MGGAHAGQDLAHMGAIRGRGPRLDLCGVRPRRRGGGGRAPCPRRRAGRTVLVHLDNSPEFVISCSPARASARWRSPPTPAPSPRDMEYFADHAGVVCAITQPCFAELVHASAPGIRFLAVTDKRCRRTGDRAGKRGARRFRRPAGGREPRARTPGRSGRRSRHPVHLRHHGRGRRRCCGPTATSSGGRR